MKKPGQPLTMHLSPSHTAVSGVGVALEPCWVKTVNLGWGNTPGRALNCSLLCFQERFLLAYRTSWNNARLSLAVLDPATWQPLRTCALNLPLQWFDSGGQEDPRLFTHRGQLHLSYTGVEQRTGGIRSHCCLARQDAATGTWKTWLPEFAGRRDWEKNWSFFSHAGDLHAVYSVSPQQILRIGEDRYTQEVSKAEQSPHWSFGVCRGGAPPVLHNGEYYSFCHTTLIGGPRWYSCCLYTFAAEWPFQPLRYARLPLLIPDPKDCPAPGTPAAVFPCGAVLADGRWLVSYGYYDTWCKIAAFDVAAVERVLEPVL